MSAAEPTVTKSPAPDGRCRVCSSWSLRATRPDADPVPNVVVPVWHEPVTVYSPPKSTGSQSTQQQINLSPSQVTPKANQTLALTLTSSNHLSSDQVDSGMSQHPPNPHNLEQQKESGFSSETYQATKKSKTFRNHQQLRNQVSKVDNFYMTL